MFTFKTLFEIIYIELIIYCVINNVYRVSQNNRKCFYCNEVNSSVTMLLSHIDVKVKKYKIQHNTTTNNTIVRFGTNMFLKDQKSLLTCDSGRTTILPVCT